MQENKPYTRILPSHEIFCNAREARNAIIQ